MTGDLTGSVARLIEAVEELDARLRRLEETQPRAGAATSVPEDHDAADPTAAGPEGTGEPDDTEGRPDRRRLRRTAEAVDHRADRRPRDPAGPNR